MYDLSNAVYNQFFSPSTVNMNMKEDTVQLYLDSFYFSFVHNVY